MNDGNHDGIDRAGGSRCDERVVARRVRKEEKRTNGILKASWRGGFLAMGLFTVSPVTPVAAQVTIGPPHFRFSMTT
jgi:hypothetical protein